MERALLYASLNKFNQAFADIQLSDSLEPHNPVTYFCKANIEYQLIQFTQSLNPLTTTTLDYTNVLSDYSTVIALDPQFKYAWYNRGIVKSLTSDFTGSMSDFTASIAFDSEFSDAFYNRGIMSLFLHNNIKGCADLSRAGELGVLNAYNIMKRYCNK